MDPPAATSSVNLARMLPKAYKTPAAWFGGLERWLSIRFFVYVTLDLLHIRAGPPR